jgi:hypothetical protein
MGFGMTLAMPPAFSTTSSTSVAGGQGHSQSRGMGSTSSSASMTTATTTSRPSLKAYHASLSTHLSSILSEEISGSTSSALGVVNPTNNQTRSHNTRTAASDIPAPLGKPVTQPQAQPQGKMYTDLKALAERDKEHLTAWYLEGYKRYIGGVNPGFVLLRQEAEDDSALGDLPDAEEGPQGQGQGLGLEQMGGVRGRKRRYTEEPGLLERRRKVLRASLEQGGVVAGGAGSGGPGLKASDGQVKGAKRPVTADDRDYQQHQQHQQQQQPFQLQLSRSRKNSAQGLQVVSEDEAESHGHSHGHGHRRQSRVDSHDHGHGRGEHGQIETGHYVSPLITPGLAFVPTPFEEMNRGDLQLGNKGGINFGQAVGTKSMGAMAGGSSSNGSSSSSGGSSGFTLSQPPANRNAIEESRRRKRAMTGSSSAGLSASSSAVRARQWSSPTLTMTNMTARMASRPVLQATPSSNSLAFVSASHLPIALPSHSSPVYMPEQHHQQQQQHHHHVHYAEQHAQQQHGRSRHHASADAALGTTSSAGLTSLTGASLGCRTHEGLTGGSSGLMAGNSLAMTELGTPASSQRDLHTHGDFKDPRDFEFDPLTPGFLPSFGLGGEMLMNMPLDPRDVVEMSSPAGPPDYTTQALAQRPQGEPGSGLGLVDEMMSKTRPTLLQRATSSFMNPDKWTLPTPTSEGNTPVDVAWDKWLRTDDDSPAPTGNQ